MKDFDIQHKKIMETLVAMTERQRQADEHSAERSAKYQKEADERSAKYQKEAEERSAKFEENLAKLQKKNEVAHVKYQKEAEERAAAFAQSSKEFNDRHQKLQESMDRANERWGGYTNNEAERLENEFYEGLRDIMQVNGVRLDEVWKQVQSKYEYDLVGINGKAIFVGEIKQKLLPKDVEKFAKERLAYVAEDYPGVAQSRKVFGMVGGGTITTGAVRMAEKYGLFVLRLKNKKLIVENAESARPVN